MANDIKCPNCGHLFDVENVISADIEQKFQQQYQEKLQQSLLKVEADKKRLEASQLEFEEKKKKENEIFAQKLQQEKQKLETELQEQLTKSISSDFENKLKLLRDSNNDAEEKLKEARQKELQFLQKEKQLLDKEAELELTLQKKLQEERSLMSEQIKKQESEKSALKETEFQMKLKELEKQLDDQKKLAEEMRRKSEQGSMQLQGEAQELLLETILREKFPFDLVLEVGKGVEGADCIQVVRNNSGKECGKIIYESKRAKNWSNTWIDKLKNDMRSKGADMAILVTQTFPKEMDRFGSRDGIWICSYAEVGSVASILRHSVMCVSDAKVSQENKGEKQQMLYDYMASNEFRQKWDAIVETYLIMQKQLSEEKLRAQKNWSQRERQLDVILKNAVGFMEDVNIIGGLEIKDNKLQIDSNAGNLLEE
jgi:hypothetical protein